MPRQSSPLKKTSNLSSRQVSSLSGTHFGDSFVDVLDAPHDLETFGEGDDGGDALGELEHLVADDAGDQVVAVALRVLEDVEVPDVEEIEGTRRIADPSHARFYSGSGR